MQRYQSVAISKKASHARTNLRLLVTFSALVLGAMLLALTAEAQENITKSHGISTFGDLKYDANFEQLDYVNPDAPRGGEFSTWAFGSFDSLTPYILKGRAGALSTIFYESLMEGTLDEPDSMYGVVAETIEYPENRQWAIFNMRPEAQFSDGSALTAEDVVFSFNILLEKGSPVFGVILDDIVSVEALDTYRVKFTFRDGANTRELPMTAAGLPIFSKAYYADRDFAESSLEPPLGSSVYVLEKVVPGQTLIYKRRDDYWGKDLPINVGRSNFARLRIEYYSDTTAAFEGFKGGSYNFRQENFSKLWNTAYDFPAIQKDWVKRELIADQNPSGAQGFWLNLRLDKFKDPRVREAIGMVFNFEWSNDALFFGSYKRTDSFWENSSLQAEGLPSEAELALLEPLRGDLPEAVFTEPAFTPAVSKPKKLDRGTLKRAGKLLDEAGWSVVNGLRQNAAGETLSIEILNDSSSFERIINPYIENLTRLGVDANLSNVDSAQQTEREKNFEFDIVVRRYVMNLTPGIELRGYFSSKSAETKGSRNIAGVSNPAVDALIEVIESAKSREELNVAVSALDRTLRAMHVWVPQWYVPANRIAYLDVFGRPETLPPFSMGEMDIWWYDVEKEARLKAAGAL
jgi:microcin C transport system substrate-binding protein